MSEKFEIYLGCLSEPIADQLKKQGLSAPQKSIKLWERMSESVSLLAIHGLITEKEKDRAFQKLVRKIGGGVSREKTNGTDV